VQIVVLGAGKVGAAIVADLARDGEHRVTAADASLEALERAKAHGADQVLEADFTDSDRVRSLVAPHDLVVGALPGPLGFRALKAVIEARKDVVDISFFGEDPLRLDALARDNGVTAVVDCGVAPGLSNMLLGFHDATYGSVERFLCCVGGLPADRTGLFQYRAPFSPIDVIAEYTRPARYVAQGEVRTEPALSQVEEIEFADVGTLEAFLTDGLRTLISTTNVPDMREKTMRYPGHAAQMRLLREMGLFGEEAVDVGGVSIRPRDLTTELLFPLWRFRPGEQDLTVMRVEIDATSDGTKARHVFELVDRYDETSGTLSMARTTGYTCTAVVRLLARGLYERKGICPPEYIGRDAACFESVVTELKARGVNLKESISRMQ
jgi:saccharopine dehydrogenase-like NADP-dependent oxidoreductase